MGVNVFGVTSTQEIEMDRLRALNSLSSAADIVGLALTQPTATVNEFATTVSLSPPAEMFRELSLLQADNQDGFRTLAGQVAEQLSLAATRDGGEGALLLNQLASRFARAAVTGTLSGLTPTPEELGLPGLSASPSTTPPVPSVPPELAAVATDAPLALRARPSIESTLPDAATDSTKPGMARAVEVYRSTLPPAMPPEGLQTALNEIYGLVQQQFSLRLRAPTI